MIQGYLKTKFNKIHKMVDYLGKQPSKKFENNFERCRPSKYDKLLINDLLKDSGYVADYDHFYKQNWKSNVLHIKTQWEIV
jgi:hypothetical protein